MVNFKLLCVFIRSDLNISHIKIWVECQWVATQYSSFCQWETVHVHNRSGSQSIVWEVNESEVVAGEYAMLM